MTGADGLKQHYLETESGVLLSKWSDRTLLDWAETILRDELLTRGFSELQLIEFRTRKTFNKSNVASFQRTLTHYVSENFIVPKTFSVMIAIIFFCVIIEMPFYIWQFGLNHESNSGNGSHADFLLGMTSIIWMPLLGMIALFISSSAARLLWPKK